MTDRSASRHATRGATLLLIGMTVTGGAFGYSYGPENQTEWQTWPDYCKARYTTSLIGGRSDYAGQVSPDVVAMWQARMGLCWRYLHHHCAAILQLNRAKSAGRESARQFAIESAIREDRLAARYCPESHPFSASIAAHMAMSYAEAGAVAKANQSLDWARGAHPTLPVSYVVKSSLLRKAGRPDDARAVLLAGNEATGGESAEIQNALGFSYLYTKDYEMAREHARKAYALGFPLPGLRDQLAAAGYPL